MVFQTVMKRQRLLRKKIFSTLGLLSSLILLLSIASLPCITGATDSIVYSQDMNLDTNSLLGNDWWSMFHHDTAHSGVSTALVPGDNQLLWSYQTETIITSSPAVAHGRVYIGSWDCNVYCFAMDSGALLWNYTTTGGITSSPAVVDGRLYIGSQDTKLYCLDAITGEFLWSFRTDFIVDSCPTIVDEKVIFGSSDGSLYCLDAVDGGLLWEYVTNGVFLASPAVVDGNVYIGDTSGKFFCLNSDTGGLIWTRTMTEGTYSSPSYSEGKIYVGCNDEQIYCFDVDDGSIMWNYSTLSDIYSSPSIAYDSVYVGTADGRLLCLNKDTGGFLWSYQISGSVTASPAVADGKVYFVTDPCCGYTSYLLCLNAYTGTKIWDSNLNTQIQTKSSPALAAGKVFVGSGGGTIFAFGDIVYMADANGPYDGIISTPVDFTGTVYGGNPGFSWYWDFGDGTNSTMQNPSHTYTSIGDHPVTLTVTDSQGHVAMDNTQCVVEVPNQPPGDPQIDGPTTGQLNTSYEYVFHASDLNGDTLYYFIDWGDNTTNGWIGPYISGTNVTLSHQWTSHGIYPVKAKAKDRHGAESNWSHPFVMTITAPELNVTLRGGFGVTITIKNSGDAPVTNVLWNLSIANGFIIYPKDFQTIPTIPPGGTITEKILVFGLHKTTIVTVVRCDEGITMTNTVQANVVLFFVFGIS